MPNANDLALFTLVVEAKSFNKAAQLADLSTPALSKKITKLEHELGVQLLYRTTRRLSLTEAGEMLYQHSKAISQQVNTAISAVSSFSEGLTGTIKMTVPTISGELLLAEAIGDFCQQHPKLTIDMRLENDFVDLVKEGLDLAIRTGILEDSSLIAKPLIQSKWVVCCAPSYIAKYGSPTKPEDLTQHNCLAYTYQAAGSYDWRFKAKVDTSAKSKVAEEQIIRISGNYSTNNSQALRKAALAGYGIVYIPKCCVYEDLQADKLVQLLPDYQARELGVYALYPYTKHQPAKIAQLIEHIRQAYQAKAEYFG